jgi:lipopolysaccharide transport system ATP-binding protein
MAIAVRFENVYKEYYYYQHIAAGFKSFLFHLPETLKSLKQSRFTALKDVSFEVGKGEALGIIGRNGSGKSTILGIIAGVAKPDRGTLERSGRISSLLELGAGFHPDLSGIENILLNGILMGNTKEQILKKTDSIVEFSELGDFIYQPLRTYSSGMQMRLGFSVAVHIDPEILLIDEALAVGDQGFRDKCAAKMLEFRKSGTTIILVSHDMASIARLCDRVVWIDKGSVLAMGEPRDVIMKYLQSIAQEGDLSLIEKPAAGDKRAYEYAGCGEDSCLIEKPAACDGGGEEGPRDEAGPEMKSAEPAPGGSSTQTEEDLGAAQSPGPATWWDSPVVMKQCVTFVAGLITDDPITTFYDYLKTQYLQKTFEHGLSICHRLKGMETSFMIYDICKTFDVMDGDDVERLASGRWNFRGKKYDMVLCVDILHRIKETARLVESLGSAMKDGGVIVALEYIGPKDFGYSDKDVEIAGMLYGALREGPSAAGPGKVIGKFSSGNLVPALKKGFEIIAEQHFGGPLYDLLLDNIVGNMDPDDEKDSALIRAVMVFERVLIEEGVLKNAYALIIAGKKASPW